MLNNCNAVIVRTTRRIIAAALPQKIAVFCCFVYKLRWAKAITTALSELFVAANAINEIKQQSTTEESAQPNADDTVVDAELTEKK